MEEVNGPKSFTEWTFLTEDGATDLSYLQIGEREFIAVLTSFRVSVFEIFHSSFFRLQSFPSVGPRSVNAFSLAGGHYIAIAGDTSELYRWNAASQQFEKFQDIPTSGAMHVQHFPIETLDFVIFSCSRTDKLTGATDETPSYVYTWSAQLNRFLLYQRLAIIGAVRATIQSTSTDTFLAIAQKIHFSDPSFTVFKWNGTYFDLLQLFPSDSGYIFTGGECVFAVSSSAIHRYDSATSRFIFHSNLPIPQNYSAATSYRYFSINTEHYLAAGGSMLTRSDSGDALPGEVVMVYKLDGAHSIQHQMLEGVSTSLSGFEAKGESVLGMISSIGVSFWKWSTCINP